MSLDEQLDQPAVIYSDGRPTRRIRDCFVDNPVTKRRETIDPDGKVVAWIAVDVILQMGHLSRFPWGSFPPEWTGR